MEKISQFIDFLSEFLAQRKGLIPVIGILLVLLNFILQFLPLGWLVESNLFLHLGIITGLFGIMLAWAL
jgi:hypothetical protein